MLARTLGSAARLGYNLIALLHFVAIWGFGRWLAADVVPFDRPDWLTGLQWAGVLAAVLLGGLALKDYDLGRFGGLWYLRQGVVPFCCSGVWWIALSRWPRPLGPRPIW